MNAITVVVAAAASAAVATAFASGYRALAMPLGPASRYRCASLAMWMAALTVPAIILWSHHATMSPLGADVMTSWLPDAVEAQAWINGLSAGAAAAWGLGAAWHLLRVARQLARIHRAVRTALPESCRLTTRPVVFSHHARSPMLVGYRHPCIVLPEYLRTADPGLVTLICAHEEAHACRRDNWWLSAEHALLAMGFWCTPLRRLHAHLLAAREELCDCYALRHASPAERRAYAEVLLSSWRTSTPSAPMSRMTDGMTHAHRRLRSILDPSFPAQTSRSLRDLSGAAMLLVGASCFVAATPALCENLLTLSGDRGVSLRLTPLGDHPDPRGTQPVTGAYHIKVIGIRPGHNDGWLPGDYRVTFTPSPHNGWKLRMVPVSR